MRDGGSVTFHQAIARHSGEASESVKKYGAFSGRQMFPL